MNKPGLVLSLFPGADLFGMAFAAEGFCVVHATDLLLGGDVRQFHAIQGKFSGVIGGPPCQSFSVACTGQTPSHGNLIPEFERIVREARPRWFVMENVKEAPLPFVAHPMSNINMGVGSSEWRTCMMDYPRVHNNLLDAWEYGAASHRTRRFSSNLALNCQPYLVPLADRHPDPWPCITATEQKYCGGTTDRRRAGRKVGRQMTLEEINIGMGLPADFATPALTKEMAYKVRGNGVPLQLGRAVARAVKDALGIAKPAPTTSLFPPSVFEDRL